MKEGTITGFSMSVLFRWHTTRMTLLMSWKQVKQSPVSGI